ncbi:MAG: LD-carboxypeptidase [Betaproteobacteria bacterium]|jgi:muramoyltetrapeptide carboxypeptidase|nr:LD-carboxypeptidase [Betaproteobacteria bacterium]
MPRAERRAAAGKPRPPEAPAARRRAAAAQPTPPLRLGMVAPSGNLPDPTVVDRATALFTSRGWQVSAGDSVFAREQRFAGPDALRAADLQAFATDPAVDLVLSARGGYGMVRLLDRLDFPAIRARRPILVGYSDFTAFHLAYLAHGGISFAGPGASDFAAAHPDPFTIEQFFAVTGQASHQLSFDADGARRLQVAGRLWGGNLALVAAMAGTRWMPPVKGGILFLEDVNESAYRIERMLYQLFHAGILQRQRAILLGSFEPVPPMANDGGFGLDSVIAHFRARLDVPLLTGLPFGHVVRKATLPVGAPAVLLLARGTAHLSFDRYPNLARARRRRSAA